MRDVQGVAITTTSTHVSRTRIIQRSRFMLIRSGSYLWVSSCMKSSLQSVVLPQPEGKDMKHIVHDFALSQEDGALASR